MTGDRAEAAFVALSEAIDAVPPENEAVFLAKLALLFALRLDDDATLKALIESAQADV